MGPISKQEMIDRVTGKGRGRDAPVRVPPPARPAPGPAPDAASPLANRPPLPMGQAYRVRPASSLTPTEREGLEAVGWDDSMPIPDGIADVVARIKEEDENLPPPVPIDTPPIRIESVPFEDLAPGDQDKVRQFVPPPAKERLRAGIDDLLDRQRAQAERAQDESRAAALGPAGREAMAAVRRQTARTEVVNDVAEAGAPPVAPAARPAAPEGVSVKPVPRAAPAAEPPAPLGAGTGVAAGPTVCPNCLHNLADTDVPEPSYVNKMAFLQSVLGGICYVEPVDLFAGNVTVVFRTLTSREIDVIYAQAYKDRLAGRAPTDLDFLERLNRYRLCLQLKSLRSASGVSVDLADGLSVESNSECTSVWDCEPPDPESGDTILPKVEEWVLKNALKTENLLRIVNAACMKFNRTVARMEALTDNADFWRPTEGQR